MISRKSIVIVIVVLLILVAGGFLFTKKAAPKGSNNETTSDLAAKIANTTQVIPTLPQGFERKECLDTTTYFLVPEGWYFKEEEQNGTKACFITKESIEDGGMFQTGVSINIIPNSSAQTKQKPSEYAYASIQRAGQIYQVSELTELKTPAPIKGYGRFIYPNPAPGDTKLNMYQLFFANDETDTLYVIWFESPATEWEKNFPTGEKILQQIGINPEY